jgi:hypothetical protein
MTYSPQFNAANPALLGQSAASAPLMSAAVQNPAMTSPMAGQGGVGSPASPALGAFQGSVATPGGPQPMPGMAPQAQGAFAFGPNMMAPGVQAQMANGMSPTGIGGQGAFGTAGAKR